MIYYGLNWYDYLCSGNYWINIFLRISVVGLFIVNNNFKWVYCGYGVICVIMYFIYIGVSIDM